MRRQIDAAAAVPEKPDLVGVDVFHRSDGLADRGG